jgi:spore maturation protein CgeB
VSVLLQCTDPRFFNPDVKLLQPPPGALFVGNSRNVRRRIVADAIEAGLALEVYGTRWEGLIPDRYLVGENIPNRSLGSYYRSASVMLNDHWDTMREAGFISNRLFDGVACGARIISDDVPGMGALFSGVVRTYRDAGELAALVEDFELETAEDVEARLDVAGTVMREHGFANRAAAILAVVQRLVEIKTEPFVPGHEVVTIGHTGNL